MMKWIDIVTPRLRSVHRAWCELRNHSFFPHLSHYNAFVTQVSDDVSLSAIFPGQRESPRFRTVGANVQQAYPALNDGMRFVDLQPVALRTSLTAPFYEVRLSQQPDCRRGAVGSSGRGPGFEQLLLPFGDDHFQVRLVHSLFAFAPGR